jgi:hypothetical protein
MKRNRLLSKPVRVDGAKRMETSPLGSFGASIEANGEKILFQKQPNILIALLSLTIISGSISVIANNNPHIDLNELFDQSSEVAIKNHPKIRYAAEITGATIGGLWGLIGITAAVASGCSITTRLEKFKLLALTFPFVYGGWKGGQALSKVTWHPTWKGLDTIQRIKDRIKKEK